MLTLLLSGDIELFHGPAMDCGSNTSFSHKMFYQNATSMVAKLQDYNVYFSDHAYGFITITETWLREDIFDNEVLSYSYNIYRRDRDSTVVVKKQEMSRRLDLETDLEILWTHNLY